MYQEGRLPDDWPFGTPCDEYLKKAITAIDIMEPRIAAVKRGEMAADMTLLGHPCGLTAKK